MLPNSLGPLGSQIPIPQRPTRWEGTTPPIRANQVCLGLNGDGEVVVWFGFLDPAADAERHRQDPYAPMVVEMVARLSVEKHAAEKIRMMLGANL